jgi:hypothetical protein
LAQQPLFTVYEEKAAAASVTISPVKMRLERSAERDKREIKNNLSSEYAQSNAERIQNRLPQNRYKENPWNL